MATWVFPSNHTRAASYLGQYLSIIAMHALTQALEATCLFSQVTLPLVAFEVVLLELAWGVTSAKVHSSECFTLPERSTDCTGAACCILHIVNQLVPASSQSTNTHMASTGVLLLVPAAKAVLSAQTFKSAITVAVLMNARSRAVHATVPSPVAAFSAGVTACSALHTAAWCMISPLPSKATYNLKLGDFIVKTDCNKELKLSMVSQGEMHTRCCPASFSRSVPLT
jgi:membrane-associated protease RseP (regulator of RpoE activity)